MIALHSSGKLLRYCAHIVPYPMFLLPGCIAPRDEQPPQILQQSAANKGHHHERSILGRSHKRQIYDAVINSKTKITINKDHNYER
jgi:hypothetical protein